MARPRRVYDTPAWRIVRLQVLERDGYRCTVGLPGCTTVATDADHIVALADGGARYDPANLRACCRACNGALSAKRNHRRWREAKLQRREW